MTYDLKFTLLWERASIRGVAKAELQVFTEMIQIPSFLVFFFFFFYDLRLSIIPANFFWVDCHLMTGISGNVPATSKDFRQDFRTLPKMSADVLKTF